VGDCERVLQEARNQDVTEIEKIPNRRHSLTIHSGWRDVADTALAFTKPGRAKVND
jgi:non-heme chloroperoxidase